MIGYSTEANVGTIKSEKKLKWHIVRNDEVRCWKCTSVTWAWQVCTATSIYLSSIFPELERRLKENLRTKV